MRNFLMTCTEPGCSELVKSGRCPKHARQYERAHPRHVEVYQDPRWKTVRLKALARDGGRCVECGTTKDLQVDHIVAIEDGGTPFDLDNTRVLCRKHHSAHTMSELRDRGRMDQPPRARPAPASDERTERIMGAKARALELLKAGVLSDREIADVIGLRNEAAIARWRRQAG